MEQEYVEKAIRDLLYVVRGLRAKFPHHDAKTPGGRNVQIKTTMQQSLTFPADYVPDYYLGIKIWESGEFSEVFNGPAKRIAEYLKNRKSPKNNLHNVSIRILQNLNNEVKLSDRIRRRS